MSDPGTNVEIEDVLTSIRRLVADSDWAKEPSFDHTPDAAEAPAKVAEPASEPSDKFVLTPSLRIVEGEEQDESVEDEAPMAELVEDLAEADDLEPELVDEASAYVSEEQTEPVFTSSQPFADDPLILADQPDTADSSDSYDSASGVSDLERMITELEAAVTRKPDEWDGQTEGVEEVAASSEGRVIVEADEVEDAEIAEEEVVTFSDEEHKLYESDEPEHALDADAPDSDRFEVTEDISIADEETLDEFLNAESVIDEEVLRQMVTEIVRQELQGALGERITRNVRKLVRREIYRVLAAKDYE